jgi:hypothetical protein
MAKKRPGSRNTRGRAKTKSAGPNARKSRPKSDNAGLGKRGPGQGRTGTIR